MAERQLGYYDHLNVDPVPMPISMETLATIVIKENYGLHRLLSEVVRQRRGIDAEFKTSHPYSTYDKHSMLTEGIADLLEKGGY